MPTGADGNSISSSGLLGTPLKMDQAMLTAIKRSVFARPASSGAPPAQTSQGIHGAQGAPHGRPNGFIGAAVPQMGAQKAPGAAAPVAGAANPQQPEQGAGAPANAQGGLAALMPLLKVIGPLLMHLFGGGGGLPGGGLTGAAPQQSTPRGGGLV
jgi:hypothetical protein